MKTRLLLLSPLLAFALSSGVTTSFAQNTDGRVTYTVQTVNYNGGYDPNHVVVVWVVDGTGKFVKTLCRHANSRIGYLYKWIADRGTYTAVDGVTSATLTSQPQTHTVTWNCRGTNGQVAADGTYYFRAEYTSSNAQGPYMASNCLFPKGAAAFTTNYPSYSNASGQFTSMSLTYTPYAEIGITRLSPSSALVDASVPLTVSVTNQTLNAATFVVAVSNLTPSATWIANQTITSLPGRAATNLTVTWNTAGLTPGSYQIHATASRLATETNLSDNAFTASVTLLSPQGSDIALYPPAPTNGVAGSVIPVSVRITNATANATGPFTVSMQNLTANNIVEQEVTARVLASNDDAEETVSTHATSLTSTDLELVTDTSLQIVGVRFQNVQLPKNATVTSAHIQFYGRAGQLLNNNPISLSIRGQAADNAAAFTSALSDISSRADTSASASWAPADWADGETGLSARTPNLSPIVQEIVSRAGWASGNAMVFKVSGSGSRRAWAYDGNASLTAQLVVRWADSTPYIGAVQTVSLAGGAATNLTFMWNTAGLPAGAYRVLAQAGPLDGESSTADNTLTNVFLLREPVRDLAVHSVVLTPLVPPNVISNVIVVVTNQGDQAESASASLIDVTGSPSLIGTFTTNIPAQAGLRIAFPWNTAGIPLGAHALEAAVQPVPGESLVGNNTQRVSVIVAAGMATNSLSARNAVWKYYDKGLDLSGAPWTSADYYDGFWPSGPSPLGYTLTNIATVISTGGVATNRHTTTYFRREFTLDTVPMSLTARVMRADGAIVYLNNKEIARHNLPAGTIGFATRALSAVTGTNAVKYFDLPISSTDLVIGRNLLAAELHLSAPNREAAGFSLELLTVNPSVPATPAFTPSALTPDGAAQSGDAAGVTVTVANSGNVTASCLVLIRDAATGAVLGTQSVGPLVPGETATVRVVLSTFGAATGSRTLHALTVANGVTNLAQIATSPFTLEAVSFTPHAVDATGSLAGRCNAVSVSGHAVFLGCGASLEAWDVQNPMAPVRTAQLRLPGVIEDLASSNGWVYAATGVSGVQIVQVASATQLIHRATFNTTGYARRLALSGNLLYIADALGGVRVLNVATPASPALAGAYATTGSAQAVASTTPRLLVLDGQRGLLNLHAASPAALSETGRFSRVTAGTALVTVPGAAIAADANAYLYRISTSSPTNLTAVTHTLLPAAAQSLATAGSSLFAAAGSQGVLVLDAASLAHHTALDAGGDASDVTVAGQTLFVAAGFGGACSFDITSPLNPQPLARFLTGGRPVDAAASGSTLYVAAAEGGLQLFSLANLGLPERLGTLPGVENARCVAVAFPRLFVAGLSGLTIFDISTPAAPMPIGSYAPKALSHIRRVAVAGDRVALTDGSTIELISIATPAAPILLASLAPGGFVFDLAAVPGELFAACGGGGLKALRMDALGVDATMETPGPATAVTVASNLLTVACGPAGWATYTIDNPASPAQVSATSGTFAFDAAASGKLLSLVDGGYMADVMNLTAPLTPVLSNSFANLTTAIRVKAVSGLVLTAEDEAGLAILNASPGDINLNGVPDEWERQIVSASSQTNGPIRSVLDIDIQTVGPNGFTYYQSYLAGLTPTDPNSVLAIRAVKPLSGTSNQLTLSWQSVAGKRYTLFKATDLSAGFSPIPAATGIVAAGPLTSFTDTLTEPRAFYMVVLVP